ncbi:hypothetical protein CMI47_20630 [Candidatus Pacearchaeota archaeon]|nr:hypothetical protein [Candidatus Pacearchaeota archaeon]|tara:strand:- start:264 stop:1268 length:1005 start_codon:yes stop_codon:yes gene_type:complete
MAKIGDFTFKLTKTAQGKSRAEFNIAWLSPDKNKAATDLWYRISSSSISQLEKNTFHRQLLDWINSQKNITQKKDQTPAPTTPKPKTPVKPEATPKPKPKAPVKPEWMLISDNNKPGRLKYFNALNDRYGRRVHEIVKKNYDNFMRDLNVNTILTVPQTRSILSSLNTIKDKASMDNFLSELGLNPTQMSNIDTFMRNNKVGFYQETSAVLTSDEKNYVRAMNATLRQGTLSEDAYATKLANEGFATSEIEQLIPKRWTQESYDKNIEQEHKMQARRDAQREMKPLLAEIYSKYKTLYSKANQIGDRKKRSQRRQLLSAQKKAEIADLKRSYRI